MKVYRIIGFSIYNFDCGFKNIFVYKSILLLGLIGLNEIKMNSWTKQDWIKDILSKSGTEITEINEDKTEG